MSTKKTAIYDCHVRLGAQMVEFASTYLPVRYDSEKEEHLAVRTAVGMFDVSHMGEFFIEGQGAARFLQYILTNDVTRLAVGQAQYSLLLNEKAGIIDDLIVYRIANDRFLLCVNAANIDKDWRSITDKTKGFVDLNLENASDRFSQLALQGPKAIPLLQALTTEPLPKRFHIKSVKLSGIDALVARTGYTGEDGVEIFVSNQHAPKLWQLLIDRGQIFSLKPCGLAARDSLRLEAGLLLHGQDMDEATTPLEAGLMFAVDLKKADFVGKNALLSQKNLGATKKLVGFRLAERGIARHGFKVMDKHQQEVGVVTSGSWPPNQETAVGLAYVRADQAHEGQKILIDIRGRSVEAQITKPKFMTHDGKSL